MISFQCLWFRMKTKFTWATSTAASPACVTSTSDTRRSTKATRTGLARNPHHFIFNSSFFSSVQPLYFYLYSVFKLLSYLWLLLPQRSGEVGGYDVTKVRSTCQPIKNQPMLVTNQLDIWNLYWHWQYKKYQSVIFYSQYSITINKISHKLANTGQDCTSYHYMTSCDCCQVTYMFNMFETCFRTFLNNFRTVTWKW